MRVLAAIFLILSLILAFGCSGTDPALIAPAVVASAALLVAIEPDACAEIPFEDIKDSAELLLVTTASVEAACQGPQPDQDLAKAQADFDEAQPE